MADIFTPVIQKLQGIGAFNFLFPFMLTSAVFYGLLRKSEVFGEPERNVVVNGVVSLMAAFMVWAYPILSGVDIEVQLSNFFAHGLIVTLVMMIAVMVMGAFAPPNLPKHLADTVLGGNKAAAIIVIGIVIGAIVFFTSGLYEIFVGPRLMAGRMGDIFLTIVVIVLLMLPLLAIAWTGGRGEGGK